MIRLSWIFDAGIADRTDSDRQRNPLQKREVDVNVEPRGLETSEASVDTKISNIFG
jgi:hypothetical protein